MPPVKVAFPFFGDTVGGSHVSAGLLIRELANFGIEPFVFSHVAGPLSDFFEAHGITHSVVNLPFLQSGAKHFEGIISLAKLTPQLRSWLRDEKIALVHTNDARMAHSWIPASRAAGIPVIVHQRTAWSPSRLSFVLLRLANKIIAISTFVDTTLPPRLKQTTRTIYDPFAMPCSDRDLARKNLIKLAGGDGLIAVFVGSLLNQKRPAVFVSAALLLAERQRNARFVLIGRETPLSAQLQAQVADYGSSANVIFSGYRSNAQALLAGADVLAAPAINEGFGRTLVEAMQARVPVVASSSGAHREIVQHRSTGLLVAPNSAPALADAIDLVFSHPHLASNMAETAYTWAKDRFSPREHALQIASLYRELLA